MTLCFARLLQICHCSCLSIYILVLYMVIPPPAERLIGELPSFGHQERSLSRYMGVPSAAGRELLLRHLVRHAISEHDDCCTHASVHVRTWAQPYARTFQQISKEQRPWLRGFPVCIVCDRGQVGLVMKTEGSRVPRLSSSRVSSLS